jgi:3-phosphoshikimate 1-carboxyvinyltransferase
MPETLTILPSGPVQGSIRPPGSKSITNRALICAALADGTSRMSGALVSEDTEVMIESIRRLGLSIKDGGSAQVELTGWGGPPTATKADLFVANSGTTIRFLTAILTTCHGQFHLDGNARMRERPIGDLLDALQQLGADVRSENDDLCPPVLVTAAGLAGGHATIRGNVSSQFLSGLLMAAPLAEGIIELEVEGELVSQPYVDLTLAVMQQFGVSVQQSGPTFLIHPGQSYLAREYAVEPDASAASYFWGAAAVTGGSVTVHGLTAESLQGDVRFCDCLEQMGCRVDYASDRITVTGQPLKGVDVDMRHISDTAQTLATVALFAEGPTKIRGVGHIRHKETDRIGDLSRELRKLGARVDETEDGMTIRPGSPAGATIETYDDHRMAMSLALAGLRVPGVTILNPGCTRKTYPDFFRDLDRIRR